MKIFKIMSSLMKKQSASILLSMLMGLLTIVSSIGMLSASSVLISRAALHPDVLDLMVLIVAVRFFSISRGIFRYLERLLSHNATFKLLSQIRRWFFKGFNDSYSENNKEFRTGDIYTRLVNDVDSLKEFYLRGIYPLVTAVLTGILTSIFLSFFSTGLSLIYLLFYIFSGFILPVVLFMANRNLIKEEQNIRKELNLTLIDMLKGITEIYVYSFKDAFLKKYNRLKGSFSAVQRKKNLLLLLGDNIYSFFVALLIAVFMVICTPMVSEGRLSGIYYAMLPLAIIASFEALIPMPNILYRFGEANNAGKSIFSIIQSGSPSVSGKSHAVTRHGLFIKGLCVREPDSERYIIRDFSLDLPYGKKVAIVGISGSGKTTFLKTLEGFMKYHKGNINLDGTDYAGIDIEEIRKNFTYIDQNPYFFNTTVRENLLIADPHIDEEKFKEAVEKAKISEVIDALPEGMDTQLGQQGFRISGGEIQRLAIARALIKSSPIILLDEPTASLDVTLEAEVINSLHEAIGDRSCIWVTHRLVGMDRMNEIILMNNGEVLERGTHLQLLDKKGLYYKLWSIQQGLIEKY
ncbi:MAG: thiol reductant ABC exporter subunit CydC [Bacillota bacterium]|nr:thiol reductant ABC exporter subunit CydC [Bacillota bacterium]